MWLETGLNQQRVWGLSLLGFINKDEINVLEVKIGADALLVALEAPKGYDGQPRMCEICGCPAKWWLLMFPFPMPPRKTPGLLFGGGMGAKACIKVRRGLIQSGILLSDPQDPHARLNHRDKQCEM